MDRILSSIGALVLSLASVAPVANAELPSGYKAWERTISVDIHTDNITYITGEGLNRQVVREFRVSANSLNYKIIGYGPRLAPMPRDTRLEIYVSSDDLRLKDPLVMRNVRQHSKTTCGECHPIINPETNL